MATFESVVAAKVLHPFELPEWERRLPLWPLHVADDLYNWVSAKSEMHDQAFAKGGRLLREHLVTTLCDFRCSKRPPAGDLRRLTPTANGIWKMHPPGLRIYGWFPAQCSFVAVAAALEAETKADKGLNDQKLREVRDFIRAHGLQGTVLLGDILAVFPP